METHEFKQLLILHLSQQDASSAAEEIPSQLFLRLDHMVDLFLHGAATNELVHKHILGLSDPEGTVGGLVFDSRIPPPVEMNDMRGRFEIEPGAACFDREHEERDGFAFLKFAHQFLSLLNLSLA